MDRRRRLTVEFKVNLLAPARAARFRAAGQDVRSGRTVTVVSGEFRVVEADGEGRAASTVDPSGELVAIMTGTMMAVRDRPGLVD